MTHASLCTGIGACELAATWMNWENLFSCEIDDFCNKVLKYHYPKAIHYENIFGQDFREWRGRVDVLTAGFPCFVGETPVLTRRGFLPIKDVEVGDEVLTTDKTYHPVECTMKHDANEIVYIRVQGVHKELKCTPNHPFYVRKRKISYRDRKKTIEYLPPEYVHAKDIKHLDKVGYPIHEGNDTSFSPAFWKLVGTWLADGWCDNNKRSNRNNSYNHKTIICCGKNNITRLHHIIQKAGYRYTLSDNKSVFRATICDEWLCEFLKDFGKYAHGKHLSPQCFVLDNERKKALLEGWFADGYTDKDGSIRITTVSEKLALDMAQIARDVYRCPVNVHKCTTKRVCVIEGRIVNERPQYHVIISNSFRYGFYENGFVWCNVRRVRKVNENNTVYNLAVNEEHSYNVHGIAVHNCQPFSLAGKRNGAEDDRYLWPEVLRVIDEIRPAWFVGENVAGITSMVLPGEEVTVGSYEDICGESYTMHEKRQRYVIEQIRLDLASIGYSVQPVVIPACAVGAPHRRDRVWFLASNGDGAGFQAQGTEQQAAGITGGGLQRDVANTHGDRFGIREDKQECITGSQGSSGNSISRKNGITPDPVSDRHSPRREGEEFENGGSENNGKQNQRGESTERAAGFHGFPRSVTDPERVGSHEVHEDIQPGQPNGYGTDGVSGERVVTDTAESGFQERVKHGKREDEEEDRARVDDRFERYGDKRATADPTSKQGGYEFKQRETIKQEQGKFRGSNSEADLREIRNWNNFPTTEPAIRSGVNGFPGRLSGITFSKWRQQSIKALGNSMVPQVVYEIFKAIEEVGNLKQ